MKNARGVPELRADARDSARPPEAGCPGWGERGEWRWSVFFLAGVSVAGLDAFPAVAAPEPISLRVSARESLRRGVEFFRQHVAVEGTYLWQYSEDLSRREGEGKASSTQGWVQPPGTPSVGMAILAAYEATSDPYYLQVARETAYGLVRGQLRSGGWTYSIDFAPGGRERFAYRDGGKRTGRNVTTLDDDTTQAALRFLMRADRALGFSDIKAHEAVEFGLASLLKAQYPNGAWPQGYDQFPEPEKFLVQKASYPENWSRAWPGSGQYWRRYTLNDHSLADTIKTLFEAARVYRDARAGPALNRLATESRGAAEKAGEFILLGQMPEPQPAWAQQYDFEMHPAWARKFEPPAVTGGESQGALQILLRLYRETGQRRFLEPIPRALDYLHRSRLPDGRLARFYELKSNRPLYFTLDYQLTYDDRSMPTHYAFKVADGTAAIRREYARLQSLPAGQLGQDPGEGAPRATVEHIAEVKAILASQDARGRWVEDGRLRYHGPDDRTRRIIRCATFVRNVETLSRYLAAPPDEGAFDPNTVRPFTERQLDPHVWREAFSFKRLMGSLHDCRIAQWDDEPKGGARASRPLSTRSVWRLAKADETSARRFTESSVFLSGLLTGRNPFRPVAVCAFGQNSALNVSLQKRLSEIRLSN